MVAFSSGLMDGKTWLLVLTDLRVPFLDKELIYGLRQTAIPIDKISAVSVETGILFGEIIINTGSSEKKITQVLKHTVLPFTNKLHEVIEANRSEA